MDWQQSEPASNTRQLDEKLVDWITAGETVKKISNRPEEIRKLVKIIEDMDWKTTRKGTENL